jgi:hypothetical protein
MFKLFKAVILSAILVSPVTFSAKAADPSPPPSQTPPQVATNPIPYSSTRTPGPKVGPSNWIQPSNPTTNPNPTATAPNSGSGSSAYYSKRGFGPAPN